MDNMHLEMRKFKCRQIQPLLSLQVGCNSMYKYLFANSLHIYIYKIVLQVLAKLIAKVFKS